MNEVKTKFDGLANLKTIGMQLDPAISTEVYYKEPGSGKILEITDNKAIYNIEQRKVASVVSKEYTLIEHRPIIEEYVDVLSKLNLNCFGNIYNYGNKIFVETAFGNRTSRDNVNIGIRMKNSYDTYTSFGLEAFGYRTVCSNGMFLGKVLKKELTVNRMHIGEIDVRDTVAQFIKQLVNAEKELDEYISFAMKDSIEWDAVEMILGAALSKKHTNGIAFALIDSIGKNKMTRWQLYNALTWYSSHCVLSDLLQEKLQNLAQQILVTPVIALVKSN